MKHILLFFGFTSILLSMKIQISSTLTNIDGTNIINANIYCSDTGTTSANDGTFSISCDLGLAN